MQALGFVILACVLLAGSSGSAAGSLPEPERYPFLLGGIQLNEDDHQRWSAALIKAGMNTVEVTVYAHQGAWNGPELWYSDAEPAVLAEIRVARQNGLQVVLILRLALDHNVPENRFLWHGLVFPQTEAELEEWFRRYTAFVVRWARVAQQEGVQVLGIASEMNSLVATLPVTEIPELAEYYLDEGKQLELRQLVGRHLHLFDDDDRIAMGAGEFESLDDFLVQRNHAEQTWARAYSFAGLADRRERMNRRRQRLLRHWQRLIAEVRSVYRGLLTLAANFDNYHEVAFWDRLDLLGINAYFPLRAALGRPLREADMKESWRRVFAEIDAFKEAHGLAQPVVFTELGYTRRSGVTVAPWSSSGFVPIWDEGGASVLLWSAQPIDPEERALAVRSLFAAWQEDRWPLAGILYWKLSSRIELGRYEPFMLYLGAEARDPLFEAMTLFSPHVRPLDNPFAAASERYARWAAAIVRGDLDAVASLRAGHQDTRAPAGTLPLLHLAVQLGHGDVVRYLADRGVSLSSRDRSGYLPLHWSCYQQDPSLVEVLAPSASVSWRDDRNETPMMKCARLDNVAVLRQLLGRRPDLVRARNERSRTALELAADQASAEMIELLIAHGGGVDEAGRDGVTPLHVAARRGDPAIVETLAKASVADVRDGAGNRPIDYAAYFGKAEAFRRLWRSETTPEKNTSGQSLLHHAAHGGNVDILKFLLRQGLEVNQPDRAGRTPLHFAAMKTHRDAARLLLEHGAPLELADSQGRTVIHLSAERNDPWLLRLFLDRAPDVEIADAAGNTPLHYAAAWGRVENARLLLAAGARRDLRNEKGQTALEVAEEAGRKRLVELLASWAPELQLGYSFSLPPRRAG